MFYENILTSQHDPFKPDSKSKMRRYHRLDFDRWIQHRFSYFHSIVTLNSPTFFWGIMAEKLIKIELVNWEKYNGRSDRPNCSWLRFQNNFFSDVKVLNLEDHEKLVLIFILCEVSKSNNKNVFISFKQIRRFVEIKENEFHKCLETLESLHLVSGGNQVGAKSYPTDVRTYERTNVTDETDGDALGFADPREPTAGGSHPDCFEQVFSVLNQRGVKPKVSESWVHAFPEPAWVIQEIYQAIAWEASSGRKKIDFGKFITNWLKRGWDSRRTTATHNRAEQRTQNNHAAGAAYLKKLEGEK